MASADYKFPSISDNESEWRRIGLLEIPHLEGDSEIRAPSKLMYLGEGFRESLAKGIRGLAKTPSMAGNVARKYAEISGEPFAQAMEKVSKFAQDAAKAVEPKYAKPIAAQEKIFYGAGHLIGTIAEFALIERVVRIPFLAMSIVEAIDEAENGPRAMLAGAVKGAVLGKGFEATSGIKSAVKRSGILAATGAAASVLGGTIGGTGVYTPSVLLEAGIGATLGLIPQVGGRKPPKEEIKGYIPPSPDISVYEKYLGSPHIITFQQLPELHEFIMSAISAERRSTAFKEWLLGSLMPTVHKKLGGSKEKWEKLIDYLDDPQYTLEKLPEDSKEIVESYVMVRTVLDDLRVSIKNTLAKMGVKVEDDWGILEGYFPHVFRGNYAIERKFQDGRTSPIPTGFMAQTLKQAQEKRDAYLRFAKSQGENLTEDDVIIKFIDRAHVPSYMKQARMKWVHTLPREAELPGWEKTPQALSRYFAQAARFIYFAPLQKQGNKLMEEIRVKYGPNISARFDRYLKTMLSPNGALLNSIMYYFERKGWDPSIVTKTTGAIRAFEILSKLGFSLGSVVANASQTFLTTFPVLGFKWTMAGVKAAVDYLHSGKHKEVIEALKIVEMDTRAEAAFMMESLRSLTPTTLSEVPGWLMSQAVGASMYLFSKVETANRLIATLGGYLRAKASKPNISEADALRIAEYVLYRTQFNLSLLDAPYVMSNNALRTVFQFKTYMLKFLEFIYGLGKKDVPGRFDDRAREIFRFTAATLAASGAIGIPGIETVDQTLEAISGESILRDIKEHFPRASRGLPGLVGFDITRKVGYGDWISFQMLTNPLRNLFGPAVQEAYLLFNILLMPEGRERQQLLERFKRQITPHLYRAVEAIYKDAKEGNLIRDYKGYPILTDLTLLERIGYVLGLNPLRVQMAREKYWEAVETARKYQDIKLGLVDRYNAAYMRGDAEEAESVLQYASEIGIPAKEIIDSHKRMLPSLAIPRSEYYERRMRRTIIASEQME